MSNHGRIPIASLRHSFVAEAKPGAIEKQLTPDTTRASACAAGMEPDSMDRIRRRRREEVRRVRHGSPRARSIGRQQPVSFKASEDLDRGVSSPRFTSDGKAIQFLVTDDRSVYPMKASLSGGAAQRLLNPPVVFSNWNFNGGRVIAMSGGDTKAGEIHVWEGNSLRQLTHQNDALFAELDLGVTEEINFRVRTERKSGRCLLIPSVTLKERRFPSCSEFTVVQTRRTSTRSAPSGRCSPRMVTRFLQSTIAAAQVVDKSSHARSLLIGATTKCRIY